MNNIHLGYEVIEKLNTHNATPDNLADTIIVGESDSGASFLLKKIIRNKSRVLFITNYKEDLDSKFKYKKMNESFDDDFVNLVLDFKDIKNPLEYISNFINQGYLVAINSNKNDKRYIDFLYSIGRLKRNVISVMKYADDLIENKLFPNDIILMKNEKSIFGDSLSNYVLGDYTHFSKKILL